MSIDPVTVSFPAPTPAEVVELQAKLNAAQVQRVKAQRALAQFKTFVAETITEWEPLSFTDKCALLEELNLELPKREYRAEISFMVEALGFDADTLIDQLEQLVDGAPGVAELSGCDIAEVS